MADIRLNPQAVNRGGLSGATYIGGLTTTDTYLVANDGKIVLHFKKTGAGAATVTFQTPGTVKGLAIAEHTVNVPALTGDVFVGPFDPDLFNDGSRDLRLALSEVTGLTVAVLHVGDF